jgi:hypothetical protein
MKLTLIGLSFFEKKSENAFFPKNLLVEKLMVASESAHQELSNEWSCQYVSTVLNVLSNFCASPLVTEVTISPY